jgi:hypothetical protein
LVLALLVCCSCDREAKKPAPQGVDAGLEPASRITPPTEDLGWPRQIESERGKFVYYQPQIDEWKKYEEISGRLAFALTPNGGKEALGVASFQAGTLVDKESHTVFFRDVKVTSVRFPSLDAPAAASLEPLVLDLFPKGGEPVSVERVVANLEQGKAPTGPSGLKNDPPRIFYSAGPAVLLLVEGDPVLAPIEGTDLRYVVNTNWDLFLAGNTYYLLLDDVWMSSPALQGPWQKTNSLPEAMSKLPQGQDFDEVKKQVPPRAGGVVPQVFFSDVPAELIMFDGAPAYTKIPGTRLLYVANTENDVFLDETSQHYYVLLSGRWFVASALSGPWSFVSDKLPEDFAKIPEDSAKGHVLVSVPGTEQASDAVMLAQIPTTAIVNKKEAEAKVNVSYDGAPEFAPIEKTSLSYAKNTQDKVIKVGDVYYLCFQGVWFMSTTPKGPWKTADSVPQEIYTIPPSSPVYNVTYVTQTNPTSETVESHTTAGYFGMFVVGMTMGAMIGYGTGYYHSPYVYYGPGVAYPVYRPYPATYGGGARYNPRTGTYSAGRRAYGPYGSVGSSAYYNPRTGRYGRSASAQSAYGGRTVAQSYNPWTGSYGATAQGHNAYSQWGRSVQTRGNDWVQSGHVTTAAGTKAGYRTSTGREGTVTHGSRGTVVRGDNGTYAGRDGNVYRKDSSGNWNQYDRGDWKQVDAGKDRTQAADRAERERQSQSRPSPERGAQTPEARRPEQRPSPQQMPSAQERPNVDRDTMRDLDRTAQARDRGQAQTERSRGSRGGGGGSRGGGGGTRGGGRGGGRR